MRVALPSLGMYEEREEGEMLSEAQRINVKVGKVGNKHKCRGVVAGITAQTPKHSSCAVTTIQGSSVFGSDPCSHRTGRRTQRSKFHFEMFGTSHLCFLCSRRIDHVCCDVYEAIRRLWARRQQAREQWIEMPQEEEERDPNEIPGMFGVGSPMRRPQYIPLGQMYTAHRGQRVHRSRGCSSLSEVPPGQVYTHYMCALCSEDPTVIQTRRQAVAAAAAKGAAKAAAAKPAPKAKAFPRSRAGGTAYRQR